MKRALAAASATALWLLASSAAAGTLVDKATHSLEVGGDIKALGSMTIPYDHLLMPDEVQGQAQFLLRMKAEGRIGSWFDWKIHHPLALSVASSAGASFAALSGEDTATGVAESIKLSWDGPEHDTLGIQGRIDRLQGRIRLPYFDFTFGRQPIAFGSTFFFAPLDLIAPFSAQVIDRSYKPGVDALRADVYIGWAGQITAFAAYAGSWDLDGQILGLYGRGTIGVFDLAGFVAAVREDFVGGVDFAGEIFAGVSLRGSFTLTVPPDAQEEDGEDPFFRGVVGVDTRFPFGLSLLAELYGQSTGRLEPVDYLKFAVSDRFERGELWTMGHFYLALSASIEVNPLVVVSVAATVNLLDGSALIIPGLSWSVAGNADLAVGAQIAVGRRPAELDPLDLIRDDGTFIDTEDELLDLVELRSEFGLLPQTLYVQLNAYF